MKAERKGKEKETEEEQTPEALQRDIDAKVHL